VTDRFPSGSTLWLLDQPFSATQVHLLTPSQFRDQAKDWGYRLTIGDLQELNRSDLLVPLLVAVDEVDETLRIDGHPADVSTPIRFAREGRIRDPAVIAPDERPPHLRPLNAPDRWTDGYFYSQWQLLQLTDAVRERRNRSIVPESTTDASYFSAIRTEHLALALLGTRYFPSIIGQISISNGAEWESVAAARQDLNLLETLRRAGLVTGRLQRSAEYFLARAHTNDPLREWWDLVRHSDHSGWFRLRDGALEAIWQRIAAEVFLRAHEDLSDQGEIPPLPTPPAAPAAWTSLHDRIGEQPHADGIERALSRLSLSPHPRVVLVLEGATEVIHLKVLLAELGIDRRQQVRIIEQGTSSDWPHELAQFVAPTLGRVLGDRQLIERGPIALVVAMDQEGTVWGSEETRVLKTRQLREIVRAQVESQGGTLTQNELEVLVQTRTWGDQKYELANFTDEELERGIWSIGVAHGEVRVDDLATLARLRESISYARGRALDIKVAFDRLQWHARKPELAKVLAPVLVEKLAHADDDDDHEHSPVIQLAYDLYELVSLLSGGGYSLETPIPRVDVQADRDASGTIDAADDAT